MSIRSFILAWCVLASSQLLGQGGVLYLSVTSEGEEVPFAHAHLLEADRLVSTGADGTTTVSGLPFGEHRVKVQGVGLLSRILAVDLSPESPSASLEVALLPDVLDMEQAVVTGTRTFQRRVDAPVMVGIIDSKLLDQTQSFDLREGLQFQPGMRVETDCQTCNYTQIRMNGLGGGYSQVLINGRPIFSPLTGLYGLEQIPASLVERIEVVRGSGSALYGSSAVGGTVNVLTRMPSKNGVELQSGLRLIDGQALAHQTGLVASLGSGENGTFGATVLANKRDREAYDSNGDGFSELPELSTYALGTQLFWRPKPSHKLEASISHLNEDRYGGEMDAPSAHEALQAESRDASTSMLTLDYQIRTADRKGTWVAYYAFQNTDRTHFTGVQPDAPDEVAAYIENPPYGDSRSTTHQMGMQFNRDLATTTGQHTLTFGAEGLVDHVRDAIPAYQYLIDQTAQSAGIYAQSDWSLNEAWTLLTGVRGELHNLVDQPIVSPRVSLMYRPRPNSQFRVSLGRGFRAPQAFDTDLHIAFAGGGISRVRLAENLREERSTSASASWNVDWVHEQWIAGFTAEAFYTRLDDAFALETVGQDAFGWVFEKRNGQGATVQGVTLEARANVRRRIQLQGGLTVQRSLYDAEIETIEGLVGRRAFLRTPNVYGFGNVLWTPDTHWSVNLGLVYTGSMELAHFAGAPEHLEDAYVTSEDFAEWNLRVSRGFNVSDRYTVNVEAGVKNLTNAYQSDFDSGKDRDSNYVYGPGMPRTFTFGVRLEMR